MSEAEPTRKDARTRARDAAWEILLTGDRPTQRNVIDRMGGGSPNTVNDVLKEFWRELGERLHRPSVPEAIVQTVDDLWTQAVAEAQNTQRQYRESADAQIDAAREEMLEAKRKASVTEASLETERNEVTTLRDRVTALSSDLASTTTRLEETIRRADLAEAHASELERVLDERNRLHDEALSRERESAKSLETSFRRQLEEKASVLEERLRRIRALETEAWVREEEQKKQEKLHEQRLTYLGEQLASRGEDLKSYRAEIESLRIGLRDVDQARQVTEIENVRIKARLEMSEDGRAALQKQVVSLEKQCGELRALQEEERKRYEAEREELIKKNRECRKRAKNLEAELKENRETSK